MKKENQEDNQELLSAKEVKMMLKISTTALWRYVNEGLLKSYRIGKHTIRFKKNEVLETLKPDARNEK
jgi:predicted DNA-binding transcriptional regulator AlpA